MTDTLRLECHKTPIHISLIEPGPIRTDFRKNAIQQFEKWVDWENSPRRADYEKFLLGKLHKVKTKPDPGELGPEAVTAKLIHALESPRPRPRYFVTTPTYAVALLKWALPIRLLDKVMARLG